MLLPRGDTIQDSAGRPPALGTLEHTSHSIFETTLVIRGIDSKGLLNAISQIFLEDFKVSITAIDLKAHDGVFQGTISVKVLDTRQVEAICQILRRNPAIHEVYRLSELEAGRS